MKQLFKKTFGKKITIKPCSSDQIGCSYQLDLFGTPCAACPHHTSNKAKFYTFGTPQTPPSIPKEKA